MSAQLEMQRSKVHSGSLEILLPLVVPRHMWDVPEVPLDSE